MPGPEGYEQVVMGLLHGLVRMQKSSDRCLPTFVSEVESTLSFNLFLVCIIHRVDLMHVQSIASVL